MHSATERDEYVRIDFDKIQSGGENDFRSFGFDVITNYNVGKIRSVNLRY